MQTYPKCKLLKTLSYAKPISGIALSASLFSTAPAQAQEQCSTYRVISGDTLGEIASRAGVPGGFQALFNANSNILSNPNIVEIGQVLRIPCLDGSLPGASPATAIPTVALPATTPATPDRPLRVITASGYAPFTDEDLEGGGALTQMVNRALIAGNPDQEFDIIFVNDWGSHLESLLPTGAADMAFPWYLPDCSRVEFLSEASAYRCTQFNHSDPLYEALVGYYTLQDGDYANVTTYAELQGTRICRPEAWFTFDLEAEQLMPPNVELTRPVLQNGCWQLLLDGEVDVVTLDALPAEEDYRELGLEGQIAKLETLTSEQTFHVYVDKNNAFANEALPILNAGLEELRLSGEWFEIVRSGILETLEN